MKLISAEFNKETGVSTVILQNRNGRYIGTAKLHPEDKEFASEYAGCRIAEKRAWIKYLKEELKKAKLQKKTINSLRANVWDNVPTINIPYENRIDLEYKKYDKAIKNLKTEIEIIKHSIELDIKARDRITEKRGL